jgi:Group II intron, maturase-specific domain
VAAFTAFTGLIRGWGNYYAYAAQSRLMDSLDAFIYREVWTYCLTKCRGRAKRAYQKYTLPRSARQVGTFQLGLLVGKQVIRLPRLSSIARKRLTLRSPPPVSLMPGRDYTQPWPGTADERWWDRHVGGGQEGRRNGQRRLAVQVLARDTTCQICHEQPASEGHHDPPWRDRPKHDPQFAMGVCSACHQQTLWDVVKSDGEPRGSKGACGVRASGGG